MMKTNVRVVEEMDDDRREANSMRDYSMYSKSTREENDSMDYFHEWRFVDDEKIWK